MSWKMYQCDVKVHAGDYVQGSVYDTLFGVDIAIAAYADLQYELLTFGNHEYASLLSSRSTSTY